MKKQEKTIVYLAIGAIAAYYLYKYYKNKQTTITESSPIIVNKPNLENPVEQVAAPVIESQSASYNVRYKISGFKLPQTL